MGDGGGWEERRQRLAGHCRQPIHGETSTNGHFKTLPAAGSTDWAIQPSLGGTSSTRFKSKQAMPSQRVVGVYNALCGAQMCKQVSGSPNQARCKQQLLAFSSSFFLLHSYSGQKLRPRGREGRRGDWQRGALGAGCRAVRTRRIFESPI